LTEDSQFLIRQKGSHGYGKIPIKVTLSRFLKAAEILATSEVGWKAKLMFAGLVAFLFRANGLNVVNSYVGRNFMTSIADRDKAEFIRQALFYIGVFAASTVVAVIAISPRNALDCSGGNS
jgi:vitamin B12/bleomycin/antimicrobial peptide transport system ATP-binding/permease protein